MKVVEDERQIEFAFLHWGYIDPHVNFPAFKLCHDAERLYRPLDTRCSPSTFAEVQTSRDAR